MSSKIKVGDTVIATKAITRKDRRCKLEAGDAAKVIRAENGSRDGIQIVAIRLNGGNQMIDIVCENDAPLSKQATL